MAHKYVGNALKTFRNQHGITQAQLADKIGVARVSISSIEKGRYIPTIETALRISEALGIPIERIFWLKDESK